jgi:hypothetical protein
LKDCLYRVLDDATSVGVQEKITETDS